jgi:TonB family protein
LGLFALYLLGHLTTVAEQEPTSSGPPATQGDESKGSTEPYILGGREVYRVSGHVTAPTIIKSPQPGYTKAARNAKIAGTVVLWLVVSSKGLPEQIRVQKSLDPGLDQNAVNAVRKWKFRPAMKDGVPVAVTINVEVNFTLY